MHLPGGRTSQVPAETASLRTQTQSTMTLLLCAQLWVTELQSLLTHSTSPDLFLTYPYNQKRGTMNFLPTPVSSWQSSVTRTCQVTHLYTECKTRTPLIPLLELLTYDGECPPRGGGGSAATHVYCTVSECGHKPTNFQFYFIFLVSSFRLPIYYLFIIYSSVNYFIYLFIYLFIYCNSTLKISTMFRYWSSFIQVFVKDVSSQANYKKNTEGWNGTNRTNFRRTGLLQC